MPLFKYSRSVINQIDVELVLPLYSILGQLGAFAAFSIPRLSIRCKMQDIINSAITLPAIQIGVEVLVPSKIAGEFSIPRIAIFADMQIEAEINLFLLKAFCQIQGTPTCEAAITLPALTIQSTSHVDTLIDCAITLPALSVMSNLVKEVATSVNGSFVIPVIKIMGILLSSESYQFSEETEVALRYEERRRHL